MKPEQLLLLLGLLAGSASLQGQHAHGSRVVSTEGLRRGQESYHRLQRQLQRSAEPSVPRAVAVPPLVAPPAAKTSALSAVKLGSAYNAFSWLRNDCTYLICDNNSGTLAHIHRQTVDIPTGADAYSGLLRYDVSIDGGASWSIDLGVLNPIYTRPARYPQIAYHGTDVNPFNNQIVWAAATLDTTPDWDGVVSGTTDLFPPTPVSGTESYGFMGTQSHIPASLCSRVDGEYWMVDQEYDSSSTLTGRFILMKGVYNPVTEDVEWATSGMLSPPYDLSFDGEPRGTIANIAWSPDGSVGWISLLGDLSGHHSYRPIFWKSTDAGATWSAPMEVDLNTESWVADSLQSLWVDSTGAPAGTGIGTTGFEHDITVDKYGNVHMGVVVGNYPGPGAEYTISSNLAKFFADVYTTDLGATWSIMYMSPVLAFRGEFGGASGSDPLVMYHSPQAARDEEGDRVYFTWVDSDTCMTGFGEDANLMPNLRAVGWRVTDRYRTCYKRVTDWDLLWGQQILFPTMARTTLRDGSRDKLFAGFIFFQIPNDELQPTDFYTLIHDTWFDDSEFMPATSFSDLSWDSGCYGTCMSLEDRDVSHATLPPPYPNPTADAATLTIELVQSTEVEMTLCNLQGQRIRTLAAGPMAAGTHKLTVDTHSLPSGIYLVTLLAGDQRMTEKLMVAR